MKILPEEQYKFIKLILPDGSKADGHAVLLSSSFYRAAISLIMSSKMFRCVSMYPISPSPCQRSEPCFSLAVRERYGNRRKNGHNRLLSRVTAKKEKQSVLAFNYII